MIPDPQRRRRSLSVPNSITTDVDYHCEPAVGMAGMAPQCQLVSYQEVRSALSFTAEVRRTGRPYGLIVP